MAADISIVTEYGGEYGTGHFQRMLLLAQKLSKNNNVKFILQCFPDAKYDFMDICRKVSANTGLIIRDKRDSDPDEINKLRKISKVVVVDDSGKGSFIADKKIDVLVSPGMDFSVYRENMFLYGYEFFKSLEKMQNHDTEKDIDVLYYHAFGNDELNTVKTVFKGNDVFIMKNNNVYKNSYSEKNMVSNNYIEYLLRAKILVTHFGIMGYEAKLLGCNVVFINPGDYHSSLSDVFCSKFGADNLGTYKQIFLNEGYDLNLLDSKKFEKVSVKDALAQITENLDRFVDYISVYL